MVIDKFNFSQDFNCIKWSKFLGPTEESLKYRDNSSDSCTRLDRPHMHSSFYWRVIYDTEELFMTDMTLIRLRLWLMEQDFAGVSQSTVSRSIVSLIDFMYLQLKQILLWPPREVIQTNLPKQFLKMSIHWSCYRCYWSVHWEFLSFSRTALLYS